MTGLTTNAGFDKLIFSIKSAVSSTKQSYVKPPFFTRHFIISIVLLILWLSSCFVLLESHYFYVGMVTAISCTVTITLVVFNTYMSSREKLQVVDDILSTICSVSRPECLNTIHSSVPDFNLKQKMSFYLNERYPDTKTVATVKMYRNNKIVAISKTLLVQGDVILLYPGETSPAHCKSVDGKVSLQPGDAFVSDDTSKPTSKNCMIDVPKMPVLFVVLKTIYGETVSKFLAHIPNPSKLHIETQYIMKLLNLFVIPLVLVSSVILALVQYYCMKSDSEVYSSLATLLPLLPTVYPNLFMLLHNYCTASVITASKYKHCKKVISGLVKTSEGAPPTSAILLATVKEVITLPFAFMAGWKYRFLPRNRNVFDTLSSVTVLCAVNKEGILSHSNPNIEKMLLLNNHEVPGKPVLDIVAEENDKEDDSFSSSVPLVASDDLMYETPKRVNILSETEETGILSGSLPNLHENVMGSNDVKFKGNSSLIVDNTCCILEQGSNSIFEDSGRQRLKLPRLYVNKARQKEFKESSSIEGDSSQKQKKKKKAFWKKMQLSKQNRYKPVSTEEENDSDHIGTQEAISQVDSIKDDCVVVVNVSLSKHSLLGIVFDGANMDQLKGRLKPVGLALLVNNLCRVQGSDCDVSSHLHFVSVQQYCGLTFRLPLPTDYCNCTVGREIGFTLSAIDQYTRICNLITYVPQVLEKGERTQRNPADNVSPLTCIFSTIVQDKVSNNRHLFSYGTGPLMMKSCFTYWDGSNLQVLQEHYKAKILEFYNQNRLTSHCFVLAYRPIIEHESHPSHSTFLALPNGCSFLDTHSEDPLDAAEQFLQLQVGQTFVGVMCSQFQPKADIVGLIEVMMSANIRFVHFSYDNELRSRAFGTKLGLETGWNCHISLAEDDCDKFSVDSLPENESQTFFYYTSNARLPQGIQNIRPHLLTVDNVPLLVPLFTSCTEHAISEMICIMKENSEVVCCMGSSLQPSNCDIFLKADCSIGVIPLLPQRCMVSGIRDVVLPWWDNKDYSSLPGSCDITNNINCLHLSSVLNTLSCSLVLSREDGIDLEAAIKSARILSMKFRQAAYLTMSLYLTLSIYSLIHQLLLLPSPLSLGLNLLICLFVVPLLSLTPFTIRLSDNVMSLHTGKREPVFCDFRRHFQYYTLRWCGMFVFGPINTLLTFKFLCGPNCRWLVGGKDLRFETTFIEISQHCNFLILILSFCVYSVVLSCRTKPLNLNFLINHVTISTPIPSLFCVLICSSIIIYNFTYIRNLPYPSYIMIPTIILLTGAMSEVTKRWDRKYFTRYQRRQKIQFNTKLGMCSPF